MKYYALRSGSPARYARVDAKTPRDIARSIRERIDGGKAKVARRALPPSEYPRPAGLLPPLPAHLTGF